MGADRQHRAWRGVKQPPGHAAQGEPEDPGPAVRPHDDQIGVARLGPAGDLIGLHPGGEIDGDPVPGKSAAREELVDGFLSVAPDGLRGPGHRARGGW